MLTKIDDEDRVLPLGDMIAELILDSEKMLKILKINYDTAEAEGQHGLSNFLAERMDNHRKHLWFLRASTKGQV